MAIALLISGGAVALNRSFEGFARLERFARPVTGFVFIAAGVYLSMAHWFGVSI
jgi:hypothetical protein